MNILFTSHCIGGMVERGDGVLLTFCEKKKDTEPYFTKLSE